MAYRNDRHFNCYSSSSPFGQQFGGQETSHDDSQEFIDQALYESDEFRMYAYKIKKCPKLRSHDWTSCPFTHRGEKARRRDPQQYNYLPIPCPGYKFGSCLKGDDCELCHGVFEYWLHPAKYRTHPCHSGTLCDRRVCFFAHTLKELRPETKYNWCYVYLHPLHIQPYPDILIENEPIGNQMVVIPCNPQPLPLASTDNQIYKVSRVPQIPSFELFVSPTSSSSQSQPIIDQNKSDFSLFSAIHAKLVEKLKNLEIGSTSHVLDENGKRPVEFESQHQEFPNINWVSDLLVDEI